MTRSQYSKRPRSIGKPRSRAVCWPTIALCALLPCCSKPVSPAKNPIPVTTEAVTTASLPLELRAVGTVEPLQTVAVRAQVAGTLIGVDFEEGQEVKVGQVLFRIDPRPYQVALKQAQATLERDQFQAKNAERESQRYQGLAEKNYVSQEQYESLRTSADSYRSVLDADRAMVDKARLDLEYCTIRSPISGRTGSVLVKAGNLVKSNDTNPLVVVNQLNPISVKFAVPEKNLPQIQKFMALRKLPAKAFAEETGTSINGSLIFVDNAVDTTTGTIALKARFDNPNGVLWPGRFVEIHLLLDTQTDVLVVPSQAVLIGQSGSFVFVLEADHTVSQRPVTPGLTINGMSIVENGLKVGEQVVIDGQLRLTNGVRVEPKNVAQKSGEASP
jgi:multidrug efflux system membrane fusion protein